MQAFLERFSEQDVLGFFAVLARLSPLFVLAPVFSSRTIPMRARAIVAVGLAVGLTPMAVSGQTLPTDVLGIAGLLGKEALVGLAVAFAIAAVFAAVQVAGALLDLLMGFSYGGLIDPLGGNQNTVLAMAYGLLGIMIFIAIGGDGWVIQGIDRTYELVPMGGPAPEIGPLTGGMVDLFGQIFASALEVAAPVLIALTLTDAAFGLVSRVVPQLNVFAVGFQAKIAVGLLVIAASIPFVSQWMGPHVQQGLREGLGSLVG